ncbi:hypothetical protein Mapa_000303 [Marchantia paleacea]|nr:hypothetical protein Mapa_000303 [Marchantia paleacea]
MIRDWRLLLLIVVGMLVLSLSFSYAEWTPRAAAVAAAGGWANQNESTKWRVLFQEEKVASKVGRKSGWRSLSSSLSRELQIKDEDYPDQDDAWRRKCASDLFALFGGEEAESSVELSRAKELRACVRSLVPSSPFLEAEPQGIVGYEYLQLEVGGENLSNDVGRLINSPPAAVLQLARSCVEWGGDLSIVLNQLESSTYPVPDVEQIDEDSCSLTKFDFGRRFRNTEINEYLTFLFRTIEKLAPSVGLNISLSRYDLFHGHMFTAHDTGRLGILFHAREFPAYDEKRFPLNLGFCQKGSKVPYDHTMTMRNIVWLAPMPDCSQTDRKCSRKWLAPGFLFVLDTSETGILGRELVPWYLDFVHTVQEEDLGDLVIDVNYFDSLSGSHVDKLFLC